MNNPIILLSFWSAPAARIKIPSPAFQFAKGDAKREFFFRGEAFDFIKTKAALQESGNHSDGAGA